MNYYYIDKNQMQQGPVSLEVLKEAGISASTPVWHEGLNEWTTASKLPELKDFLDKMPPPFNPVQAKQPTQTKPPIQTPRPQPRVTQIPNQKKGVSGFTIALIFSLMVTVVLIIASPIVTAFIANIFGTSPQMVFIPILIAAIIWTIIVIRKRQLLKISSIVIMPILLPLLAGALFYSAIRECGKFRNGVAEVHSGRHFGIINRFGLTVIPIEYNDIIYRQKENLYIVEKNGQKGTLSLEGKELIPCKYTTVFPDQTGMYRVNIGGNKSGSVTEGGKWGYYTLGGEEVIPCIYDEVYPLEENEIFEVSRDGKVGLYDKSGNVIVSCDYFYIWSFENGLAKVNKGGTRNGNSIEGGTWGYINRNGKEVIPCRYTSLGSFENGTVTGYKDDFRYKFDRQGNILECVYTGQFVNPFLY